MLSRIRKTIDERDEGFTLIELLVVMIIIGILAAIAIPVFLNQRNSGYDAGTKSDVKNGSTAEETFFTDNNLYTSNGAGAATSATGPLSGWTKSANTTTVTFTATAADSTASPVVQASYKIVGVSKSGKSFCFNSVNAGNGVVSGATC